MLFNLTVFRICLLSQQVNVGVTAFRALMTLDLGSLFTLVLRKRPREASPMEAAARDSMPCCTGQFSKSSLPFQSDRSPLILYGLELGFALCSASSIATPSLVMRLSPGGAKESSHHRLPQPSSSVPAHPSSPEVGESSEERKSLDDINYYQLLKDYCEVQAVLSSTRLNAEIAAR
jgi:hypothetical protein